MLVSYKWLGQYVDLSGISPHELAEKITRAGIEVDVIHERKQGIQGIVVGHVLECKQHPNADKLRVCRVDLGEGEPVQIVCGAPNVAQGQKVVVAKVGAVLPGNFKIKKAKLRGEESHGMICSAQELGIPDRLVPVEYRQGIMVLPDDLEVGSCAISALDLDDHVLELDLTPNRSDALSMLGVAYEVAAILDREVRLPELKVPETEEPIEGQVQVEIADPDLCPHYAARLIKDVQIAPSPLWLQNRLIAAGVRPINNVVDVTNYVMLEYGQPLHAFDAANVQDGRIIVRRAREGEKVVTLDDQERTLQEGMLLITDPDKIIGIAGVMGGANSEVKEETKAIILESAYFAGSSIRATSKALGLRSEASLRFEKGVDPERVHAALDRAALLLAELAGGKVAKGIVEERVRDIEPKKISLQVNRLNQVLGTNLRVDEVTKILARLGFEYELKGEELLVRVPTRRPDLQIEEDLIEEVARIYGYDLIPTTLPEGSTTPGARTPKQKLRQTIKRFLQGAGLSQVITYSLTSKEHAELTTPFTHGIKPIKLAMPMSEERSHLRTSVIPTLLEVLSYNKNRQQKDVHLFELGHIFLSEEERLTKLPEEKEMVAGVLTGLWQNHPWQQVKVPVDFYVAKGIVEGLFQKLGITAVQFEKAVLEGFHPGRTALIKHQGEVIGYLGQIHPEWQKKLDLDSVYAFELSLEALLKLRPEEISYVPLPKYPSMERDIAILVDEGIEAEHIRTTIKEAGGKLLQSVQLFDVYVGERIEKGKKSLAFSLIYQDPEKTLTDETINQLQEKIIEALASRYQAELRK